MRELKVIIERLEKPISKAEISATANEIVNAKTDFTQLFDLLIKNNQVAMRTAWLIENILIPNPKIHKPYFNFLAKAYLKTKSSSVRRNIGKTIAQMEIPENWEDELYDFTTKMIVDSNEVVATKVHAMIIAANIASKYPELIPELKETIEGQFEKNTVAFRAASKRAFKKFKKAGY